MNYKITCNSCKKKVTVSTRDAVRYEKDKVQYISFDCPNCEEEIEVVKPWGRR